MLKVTWQQELQDVEQRRCRAYKTETNSVGRMWATGLETVSGSGMRLKKGTPDLKSWVKNPEDIHGGSGAG